MPDPAVPCLLRIANHNVMQRKPLSSSSPPPSHVSSTTMRLNYSLFVLSLLGLSAASDNSNLNDESPCVARSPVSGLYYDLNAISLSPPELKNGEQLSPEARNTSWHSKGHDYPANFTLNICAPVIEDVKDVVGVDSSKWQNISAYYERDGKIYSIGYGSSLPWRAGFWLSDMLTALVSRGIDNRPQHHSSGVASWS